MRPSRTTIVASLLGVAVTAMALANLAVYPLPIPADLRWPAEAALYRHIGEIAIPVALFQCLVLVLVYRHLKAGNGTRIVTLAMGIAIVVSSVTAFSRPPQSSDVYAYIGYAKLPTFAQAYAPPDERFTGTFARVNLAWGTPMVANVYGPLWLGLDRLVVGTSPTLANALLRTRVLNVVMLAMLVGLLVLMRVPAAVTWLVAINPFIWNYFVFSAHNDIIPVVCMVAAIAVAARWPMIAVALATAAALCKISFFVIALVPFARMSDVRRRVGCAALTVGLAALGSWFAGGRPYLDAIGHAGTRFAPKPTVAHAIVISLHVLLASLAITAVIVVLFRRNDLAGAAWSFMALGAYYCPWYSLWGLPYALVTRRSLAAFVISLPIVGAVVFSPLSRLFQPEVLAVVILIGAGVEWWKRNGGVRRPLFITAAAHRA
jgi:hypothetical protein